MAREIFNKMIEYIKFNKGKVFGGIIGFIIAILVLIIGFFKTFFIVVSTWVGYYLGSKLDNRESIGEFFKKILLSIKRD